ncbi:unnamed protein product [Rotaria magnacalcarata]|uniref:Solute carrier family 25 member 40 n=1 Tax=Rotaria magnacalcarata TaxID=392030 RepID=A0A816XIZ7_9BILA|nr:unnamed protein product [Rotaria magnacalcarata]CAF1623937.1 unnamed protein product [Rotaria magnacalcarata]CAF1962082.1 unnamed protein product [Rotaria magnacalcarata]CAF2134390.1 unnamed protein product [Rotaria magnacalcarata]CAF2147468.1 unnamed protein product [Rotaria magnacalcarata]
MANDPALSPIKPYQQIIASGSGAVLTALFMTPFDVIKVRLQSQTSNAVRHFSTKSSHLPTNAMSSTLLSPTTSCQHYMTHQQTIHYTGTLDTLSKIIRAEGFPVLWSGLTPALCVSIPTVIIYFTSYMKAKQLLGYNELSPNPILPVIAGASSRIFAVTAVSPFELIRTKVQSEKVLYRQLFLLLRKSLSEEGPRILWKGLLPTIWRDIPFSMIYWFHYETFRAYLVRSKINVDTYGTFICGALAGTIAATLTTPADVAKTFRQIELGRNEKSSNSGYKHCSSINSNQPAQSTKTLSILIHIFRAEGLKGLFTGLVPRLLKVAPACAIMITSFETLKTFFQRMNASNI